MHTLRNILALRIDREDKGATMVLVAMSLLMLFGFAALAIDAGLGYNDRRGTQNAADNAALAAAWEACNPKVSGAPNPTQAALQTAADNGYDNSASDVTVTATDQGDGEWQIDIAKVNQGTFGQATPYANDQLTIVSSATAQCDVHPFLGGYAIFADAPSSCNGGVELDLSGASKIINGGIHSNGDVKITGSSTTVNGQVTYVGSSNFTPSQQVFSALDYPIIINVEDYAPGGSRATPYDTGDPTTDEYFYSSSDINDAWIKNGYGTSSGSDLTVTQSGVYFTEGDIKFTKNLIMGNDMDTGKPVKVTFVARGQISISAKTDISGFDPIIGGVNDPGVALFSNYEAPPSGPTCTGNAINISSSGVNWTGLIYAPYGAVTPSFSSGSSLNGSIIAYTVNVSGADFNISWQDNPAATPDFEVNLLK